jgi:hypothetical protein
MTLGELAYLLDVDPKWVQNVAAATGGGLPFTLSTARRLVVVRALGESLGVPVAVAWTLSADLLHRAEGLRDQPVLAGANDGTVMVMVDVYRVLAAVNTGLSRLRTSYAPKRRGRPTRAPRSPIARAAAYGLDLTLLAANLRRTPTQRLRQLDAMVDFRRRVRRESGMSPLTTRRTPRPS